GAQAILPRPLALSSRAHRPVSDMATLVPAIDAQLCCTKMWMPARNAGMTAEIFESVRGETLAHVGCDSKDRRSGSRRPMRARCARASANARRVLPRQADQVRGRHRYRTGLRPVG